MRAVECLVVCGLPAQPVTVDGVAGFVGAGESYRPEVLQSYPPTTGLGDLLPGGGDDDSPRDDGEMGQRWPPHLAACAMPRGVDVHVASNPPPDAVTPASYPIVLTDAHGDAYYCACLSILAPVPTRTRETVGAALRSACARQCVVLVSRAPILDAMTHALNTLVASAFASGVRSDAPSFAELAASLVDGLNVACHDSNTAVRHDSSSNMDEKGLTPPTTLFTVCGKTIALPPVGPYDDWVRGGGGDDDENDDDECIDSSSPASLFAHTSSSAAASFEPLLRALDERNVARALCAVACQRRVLLRASSNSLLVLCAGALLRAMKPLRYRSVFVPCLPVSLLEYLDARAPFLMGLRSDVDVPAERLRGIVVIDLDANRVRGDRDEVEGKGSTASGTQSQGPSGNNRGRSDNRSRSKSRGKSTERGAGSHKEEDVPWPGDAGEVLVQRLRQLRSPELCEMDSEDPLSPNKSRKPTAHPGSPPKYRNTPDARDVDDDTDAGGDLIRVYPGAEEFRDALRAAARAQGGKRGRRWSKSHDECARLCFAYMWRCVPAGYRAHLADGGECLDRQAESKSRGVGVKKSFTDVTFRSVQLSQAATVTGSNPRWGENSNGNNKYHGELAPMGHVAGAPSTHASALIGSKSANAPSVPPKPSRPRAGLPALEPPNTGFAATDGGEDDVWANRDGGGAPAESGLGFLGFNDKRTGTPNTPGRQIPAKASSSTAGLRVFDPGSVAKELNPESGVKPFKSNSAGRTKPKHGRSASSTSFFAAPSSPPRVNRAVGSSNSESDGEGSVPVKTNSGKNLAAFVQSMSPPRMFSSSMGLNLSSPSKARNFRERRRVSVDVQDGGTHKPGSHAVGVDTGGGLTDSGEKTSSSKSASKSSGGGIFGLTFRSRRKSEAARFKSDVRGESEKGAGNYANSLAEMTARSSHSGGELSQWIAMSKSDTPDAEKSLTKASEGDERLGDRVDGSEKNPIDTGDRSHSIHGDVPASVPIESALVHASPVETAAVSGGGVIDDSGPPDGIEADSSVKSKPLSARSLQRMKSFGESPRFDRGRSVGGEGDDVTATETAAMDTKRRDVPAEAVDAGAHRPKQPAEAGGSVKKEVDRIESRLDSSTNPSKSRPEHKASDAEVVASKTRELWALASAGAAMRARAAAAAAAIIALKPSHSCVAAENSHLDGSGSPLNAPAELAAVDLDGVLAAMEGLHGELSHHTALRSLGTDDDPIGASFTPGLLSYYSGQTLRLIEEDGPGSPKVSGSNPTGAKLGSEAERRMRAADEEVKRRAEADAKRQIEASKVAAANEVAAAPGFPAAFNAAAVAAIASGDASKVHVILRIVRAPGTPAFARALPGGAKTWSDPAVWIGLDRFYNSRLVDSRMGDEADDNSNSGNGAPYIGSRRDLAWRMASVGLPPHAIGGILARLPVHDDSESSLPGEPTRQMDIQTLNSIQKDPPTGKQGSNTSEDVNNRGNGNNDANNTGLPPRVAPVPVASADRVGRSVGRVWEVSKSVNNNNDADANIDDDQIAKSGGGTGTHFGDDDDAITRIRQSGTSSGAGAAIVHDAWIERMRLAARASSDPAGGKKKRFKNGSSIGSADSSSIPDDAENTAPWWALPTGATGIGGKSPFSLDAHCGRSVKSLGFAKRRNNSGSIHREGTVDAADTQSSLEDYLLGLDLDGDENDTDGDGTRDWKINSNTRNLRTGYKNGSYSSTANWRGLPSDVYVSSPWSHESMARRDSRGNTPRAGKQSANSPSNANYDEGSTQGSIRGSNHAITAVACSMNNNGGSNARSIAVGSCFGAFAVWNPSTGAIVRARAGGWGEADAGHYNPNMGLTALGFTGEGGFLAVGGTRGGGVAAWDVRTGACVSASPGSHAGAVTVVLAATGPGLGGPEQVGTNPSNSSSNSLNPALVLTASSAPGDGRVRLWDVRTGPRETAAALGGHVGGVTAVSPSPNGQAGSGGAFFTGDGAGTVRAWDWRRAGGGAVASARGHVGSVTAVTSLHSSRADVAASAGVDGVVRVLSLDGADGGCIKLVGHLGPVTCLRAVGSGNVSASEMNAAVAGSNPVDANLIRGKDASGATIHSAGGSKVKGHRRLSSIMDLAPNLGSDYFDGGAIDSLTHNSGHGTVGLASGSVDGTVRLWCPNANASRWHCAAVGHAHDGPILSMETNASGSLLTAASDASFARWPDSEPFLRRARFGSSGIHSSGALKGGGVHGRQRERAGGSNHGSAAFASFSGSNNSGKRLRHFEFGGGGGAAWTPTRMHHRVDSPRVCAIDPSGAGRMVMGTRDGVVTCASLD